MADDPHSHSHSHAHGSGEVSELSDLQLRVRALETILTEKGYIDPAALDAIVEACETQIGPHNGARIVAHAWADPGFKKRLLEDATQARATMRAPLWGPICVSQASTIASSAAGSI